MRPTRSNWRDGRIGYFDTTPRRPSGIDVSRFVRVDRLAGALAAGLLVALVVAGVWRWLA
ncbi:MAG TPA: hypothetical protein VNM48_11665 [Chloroflexota bacterium]|nr:hypothetical protein [Chloroflexota bacterium]